MCTRPDFKEIEQELNIQLIELFQAYSIWMELWVDEWPNTTHNGKLECFKEDISDRLVVLEKELQDDSS